MKRNEYKSTKKTRRQVAMIRFCGLLAIVAIILYSKLSTMTIPAFQDWHPAVHLLSIGIFLLLIWKNWHYTLIGCLSLICWNTYADPNAIFKEWPPIIKLLPFFMLVLAVSPWLIRFSLFQLPNFIIQLDHYINWKALWPKKELFVKGSIEQPELPLEEAAIFILNEDGKEEVILFTVPDQPAHHSL